MKKLLILTLFSSSLFAADIYLECKPAESQNQMDMLVTIDMANKIANVSTIEPTAAVCLGCSSGVVGIVVQPQHIILDGYIQNLYGDVAISFSINRKTLEMGFSTMPDLKKGSCAKVEVEDNIF